MMLEKAIKLLKQYQGYEPMFPDGETLKHAFDLTDETVDTLLSALRPVSREQVERMRGEWEDMRESYNDVPKRRCSRCKGVFIGLDTPFCEVCGAPMTDEAVEMVLERLEALYGKAD